MSQHCCVIGTGFLGSRIIGELARLGLIVNVYDSNETRLRSVLQDVQDQNLKLVNEGLCSGAFKGEIKLYEHLPEAVKGVSFIFEAITDNLEIKKWFYQKLTHNCNSDAIICSNTLNVNLDEMSSDSLFKERIIGCRFLAPVYCVPVVESSLSSFTSRETVLKVKMFFENFGIRVVSKVSGAVAARKLSEDEVNYYWRAQRQLCTLENPHRTESASGSGNMNLKSNDEQTVIRQDSADSLHEVECEAQTIYNTQQVSNDILNNCQESYDVSSDRATIGVPVQCNASYQSEPSNFVLTNVTKVSDPPLPAAAAVQHASTSHCGAGAPNVGADQSDCVICSEFEINTVILPCGHMWLCYECAVILRNTNKDCPACRCRIENIVLVFKP